MREDRNDFEDVSTVMETIIEQSSDSSLNYYNTSLTEMIGNIEYTRHNVIYDYLDELLELSYPITMNDTEYIKYEFRPDLLSYDIYGTLDYDFVILALNSMLSPKEFTKKKVKLIRSKDLSDIINRIYNAEANYILKNKNQ